MKKILSLVTAFLLLNCSSTHLVESWKNPDIDTYEPYKIFVVGLTSDKTARQQFEEKLKSELELRGYEAVMSASILDNPGKIKITETELDTLESKIIEEGFDTILLTKIIGIKDKVTYRKNYNNYNETYRGFKDEYLRYQDIFYNPDYYQEFQIYKAETSMYCICPTKARELIWKVHINITDPRSIEKTVNDYVRLTIVVLEEEQLINTSVINEEKNEDIIN